MPRYIDADEIFYDQLLNTGSKEHPLEYAVSKRRIDDMPTADVVEVVRCKDCKHGRPYKNTKEYVACEVDCEPIDRDSDFFCADGGRREDE